MNVHHRQNSIDPQQLFRDEFVFNGSMVWIGTFNCHYSHQMFGGEHCFYGHQMVVFPRTTVKLTMLGKESILGSPNAAIFYNQTTVYKRQQLEDEWDRCEFFQFNSALLFDILAVYNQNVWDHVAEPFPFTHTYLTRNNYLYQRKLVEAILNDQVTNKLKIDETVVHLLESLIDDSFAARGISSKFWTPLFFTRQQSKRVDKTR